MLERIFRCWKTTVGGLTVTAVLTIISATYKPGMTLKVWALLALPMIIGAALKDPEKK